MNCLALESLIPDYLAGGLTPPLMAEVQGHLAECAACRNELQDLSEIWTKLEVLPVAAPSAALRAGFYAMLEDAKGAQPDPQAGSAKWLTPVVRKVALQFAAGFLLVAGGWVLGGPCGIDFIAHQPNPGFQEGDSMLSQQVDLALLSKPAISKRMLGVALISRLPASDPILASALLDLVKQDPSDQVRAAAVGALYQYTDHLWVQEELEGALSGERSPLVQSAMVDLLKDFMDDRTLDVFRTLIQDRRISPEVRERVLSALSVNPCNLPSITEYSYYSTVWMKAARGSRGLRRSAPDEVKDIKARERWSKRRSARGIKPRERTPWYVIHFSKQNT